MTKRIVSIAEYAKIKGVTVVAIYRKIKRGKLKTKTYLKEFTGIEIDDTMSQK